jgi:hypothetical protein
MPSYEFEKTSRLGSCEEIDPPDFSGDPKCLRTSQSSPTGLLKEKFLNADFAEIAILHFFTASCPRVSEFLSPSLSEFWGLPTGQRLFWFRTKVDSKRAVF